MSRLLKLLYDVADIRCQYQGIHDSACGFSPRNFLMTRLRAAQRRDSPTPVSTLDALLLRLQITKEELDSLAKDDLSIRRGHEIQDALIRYVEALTSSMSELKALCELDSQCGGSFNSETDDARRALRTSYDDAMQHHKRLGLLLNQLISGL